MINMEKVKPITPEEINNINDVWMKIETVYPETTIIPTYDYWNSQNTLDAEVSLRNLTWTQYMVWNSSRTTVQWTWTQVITWIWFKPKMITIQAVYPAVLWSISYWQATSTSNEFSVFLFANPNAGTTSYANWAIIHCDWSSSWSWNASLQSIDIDWFTLNWTSVAFNVVFMYQCYW